jgi:hypothetical protein
VLKLYALKMAFVLLYWLISRLQSEIQPQQTAVEKDPVGCTYRSRQHLCAECKLNKKKYMAFNLGKHVDSNLQVAKYISDCSQSYVVSQMYAQLFQFT